MTSHLLFLCGGLFLVAGTIVNIANEL